MMVSDRGAQARRVKIPTQAVLRGSAMLLAVSSLLVGCSTTSSMDPVNWWHRQEGGKIAEQRPPPPGADQPFPNMATVPAKPETPDAEALKKLTASLVADRTNAQHAAQSAPLADPSSPTASPSLFGVGTGATAAALRRLPDNRVRLTGNTGGQRVDAGSDRTAGAGPPAAAPSAAPRKAVEAAPLARAPAATTRPPRQPTAPHCRGAAGRGCSTSAAGRAAGPAGRGRAPTGCAGRRQRQCRSLRPVNPPRSCSWRALPACPSPRPTR